MILDKLMFDVIQYLVVGTHSKDFLLSGSTLSFYYL